MTIFLLIRHGETDAIGNCIPGRMPGVHLNAAGRRQAETLAQRLSSMRIDAIYASPMERTRETAEPIARQFGLRVEVCEGINEVDFGEWTGLYFGELEQNPGWIRYNRFRTGTRIPGGEMPAEVKARMLREIERIRVDLPDSVVVLVSHGDPIKNAIAPFLGIPLEHIMNFEISTASVSILLIVDSGARILCLNRTEELPRLE